ncbi:hypothetical protein D3C72_2330960 [compost metagenome]
MMVRMLESEATGPIRASGMSPKDRAMIISTKPMMNHGTICCSFRRPLSDRPWMTDRAAITGPSIKTRMSLTMVPVCTAIAPSGAVAASTCGTA